jgi:UDP-N-acetylglucosamine 1-carboxyvinyltransferase
MEKFVITGGKPLQGEIDVRGAKNAAFPVLAATILTDQDCVISNLPLIEDVKRFIELLQSMEATVTWEGARTVRINTKNLNPNKIDRDLVLRFRGSILLFGPLLARFGKLHLPQPGGCLIGPRPIDTHIDAFAQLGVSITEYPKAYRLRFAGKLKTKEVVLNEFSVTATENILLFASMIAEPLTIKIADQDYQVQELTKMLRKMGVRITNPGLHSIKVEGKKKLKGVVHELLYDPIEAGTFMLLAAAVGGKVLVKNVELAYLDFFFKKLKDFHIEYEIVKKKGDLANVLIYPSKDMLIDKIQSWIYPGIASDLQNVFGVLATQTPGSTLLHDPLYPGRLKYLDELGKMGAEIYIADPHRAIINGPTKLKGTDLGSFDLRGGASLIIAALIAQGESSLSNIYQVDRGYERIEERLQKLGADIKRVDV